MNKSLPQIYTNIFEKEYFDKLKKYLSEYDFGQDTPVDYYGSHRLLSLDGDPVLNDAHIKITEFAKEIFNDKNIIPTYCTYIRYFGKQAELKKHLDEGPAKYLIDLGLGYKTQWPIIVEDKEFIIDENEALAFYPKSQVHWRTDFPEPETNIVEMLMFSFEDSNNIWWKIKDSYRVDMIKRFLSQKPNFNKFLSQKESD